MTAVIVTAVGFALGVVGMVSALHPAPPSLRAALADLERDPSRIGSRMGLTDRSSKIRPDLYLAGYLGAFVSEQDYARARLWPLFAITGTSIQELCGEIVLAASVGLLLPIAWWALVGIAGVHLPLAAVLWASLILGAGGALLPVLVLRSRARRARMSARRAIGSFLNLVVLCLAGGMGIESALHASARIGEDRVSERILDALVLAQDAGEPPWDALDRLGHDLGLTELSELAAAVGLAGTEGARIRLTLAAKASSIRRHNLSDAESEANAVTERLFLPGVCLLVGFLLFIAYPAVARISAGF